jgi:hypothetical protein
LEDCLLNDINFAALEMGGFNRFQGEVPASLWQGKSQLQNPIAASKQMNERARLICWQKIKYTI